MENHGNGDGNQTNLMLKFIENPKAKLYFAKSFVHECLQGVK